MHVSHTTWTPPKVPLLRTLCLKGWLGCAGIYLCSSSTPGTSSSYLLTNTRSLEVPKGHRPKCMTWLATRNRLCARLEVSQGPVAPSSIGPETYTDALLSSFEAMAFGSIHCILPLALRSRANMQKYRLEVRFWAVYKLDPCCAA